MKFFFKTQEVEDEYKILPVVLKMIIDDFGRVSYWDYHKIPTITSVWRSKKKDSGVHEDWRGVDIRDEYKNKFTYNKTESAALVRYINKRYPRTDRFKTCVWHSVQEQPYHFHLQVPRDINTLATKKFAKIYNGR